MSAAPEAGDSGTVDVAKEKKLFAGVLWLFLTGALVFYIVWISAGRAAVPAPVWLMLLLLDVAAVVLLFVPMPGRQAYGMRRAERRRGWFPRSIGEIVERPGDAVDDIRGRRRRPGFPVEPVPLIPLLILLVVIILTMPVTGDEEAWREEQGEQLADIYEEAELSLHRLEAHLATVAGQVQRLAPGRFPAPGDLAGRAGLCRRVDSLAAASGALAGPFEEVGIQLFDLKGERAAWGGRPRFDGRVDLRATATTGYIARTRLYTLLVREVPLPAGGRAALELPLAVNYRISNRFLRSFSVGDMLSERLGASIEFSFWMGAHGGSMRFDDGEAIGEGEPALSIPPGGEPMVRGLVRSTLGLPLARLTVRGASFEAATARASSRRALWAGLLLALCVTVIARHLYRRYGKRSARGGGRAWISVRQSLLLLLFLALIRFILLRLEIPSGVFGLTLFDPAIFADDLPGGLMRTAGDFLISATFLLMLVFGAIKVFRTHYGGLLERPPFRGAAFSVRRLIVKAPLTAAVLAGAGASASALVARTVLNSNPRIIGLDAGFFSIPVLALHMALLFAVSALLIAAVFLMRLLLSRGGGPPAEGFAASAAGLVILYAALEPHWSVLVASAALIGLAFRVFPLLRKEELLSVIFASFFLVIVCSVVIYGVASAGYDELRRQRVVERARDFNYPEDNWLQIVLPDMAQEIAADRSIVSKVLSRDRAVAFEVWAGSELSRFNLACRFDVFDAAGRELSTFSVGLPLEIEGELDDAGEISELPEVARMVSETDAGKVHYFVAVAPLYHITGRKAGRVEVKAPYFYEDPSMLTGAGPMAPEILRNIERGSVAPRIDEPEQLLVARVEDGRVADSSSPLLAAREELPAPEGAWFEAGGNGESYNCVYVEGDEEGSGYVVGYLMAGFNGGVLRWAAVISVDIMLTIISLAALLVIRRLPVLGSVTPDLRLTGRLGFKRKLLLSFTVVSVLPIVLMGLFANRYIRYSYRVENEGEALEAARAAGALVRHSVRSEAAAFARTGYLVRMLAGGERVPAGEIAGYEEAEFALVGPDGALLAGTLSGDPGEQKELILEEAESGRVTVALEEGGLYAGTVVPVEMAGGTGYLYFRRRLDDRFASDIAAVGGRNLNIYYGGELRASSERELFTGGFLTELLESPVYAGVALGSSRATLTSQTLGDYSYQISSIGLERWGGGENAVISVPHLYRTAVVRREQVRTSAVILGLLALIFCVAVTLGVFLAGKIFNPIAALQDGTRRIMKGDLEFRLEPGATDEIGDLVSSFNTMTEALRDARRTLLERQRYLGAVLDHIGTGVIAADSGGRIMTLNPAGEKILGISQEEVLGRVPTGVQKEGLEGFFALFEKAGTKVAEEEVSLGPETGRRTLKTVVATLEESGERLGTVIVFDDLTELIRTKKLSAWVEMARQIAHEVKNPLTPIRLSAQFMKRAHADGSDQFEEIFESGIETVLQQTEILRQIASEFSSFGKTVELAPVRIDLVPFVSRIADSYRGTPDAGIRIGEDDGAAVIADPEALRKIMVNLIENALEAMGGEGEISIFHETGGGRVRIKVVDSGTGLSGEAEKKLFEPYFSTKTNGTGLGLAICQSLAREMGGRITLRNRTGAEGVEAVVDLPSA